MYFFPSTEPFWGIFKPEDLCHNRAPHRIKLILQQSEYLKTDLSYFLFFHLGNCKKNSCLLAATSLLGRLKKKGLEKQGFILKSLCFRDLP